MTHSTAPVPVETPRYETRDISPVGLLVFGVLLCLLIVLALSGSWRLTLDLAARQRPETAAVSAPATPLAVPAPHLQINPPADLSDMRHAEEELLRTYGWVDRPAGTIRIPIERAMDILAAREVRTGEGR